MKKYIPVKESAAATHVLIETRYNLGGMNYFTYTQEKRGYYLHVTPVKLETRNGYTLESVTAFSGVKQLVKAVTRKSAKAEAEAEAAAARIENTLVSWVLDKNGLELVEGATV